MTIDSRRPDRRGHWPKGRRRHKDLGDWQLTRLDLIAFLDEHHEPRLVSMGAIAASLKVWPRTVHRWLAGINRPTERAQAAMRAWLKLTRAEIKRRAASRPT